jgi:hypothetical protein
VDVSISVAAGDAAELESLDDWLPQERELAGRVKLVAPEPRDRQLGSLAQEIVITAVGSGGAITAAVVASLKAWLSLPRRSHVKIRLKAGQVVEIEADRLDGDRVEALIRQALDPEIADTASGKFGIAVE